MAENQTIEVRSNFFEASELYEIIGSTTLSDPSCERDGELDSYTDEGRGQPITTVHLVRPLSEPNLEGLHDKIAEGASAISFSQAMQITDDYTSQMKWLVDWKSPLGAHVMFFSSGQTVSTKPDPYGSTGNGFSVWTYAKEGSPIILEPKGLRQVFGYSLVVNSCRNDETNDISVVANPDHGPVFALKKQQNGIRVFKDKKCTGFDYEVFKSMLPENYLADCDLLTLESVHDCLKNLDDQPVYEVFDDSYGNELGECQSADYLIQEIIK